MYRKSDLTGQDGGTVLLKPYRAVWGEDEDEGERRRDEQEEGGREEGSETASKQTLTESSWRRRETTPGVTLVPLLVAP